MIPFANDTVTIVHHSAGGWISTIANGCSYRRVRIRAADRNALETTEETVCRIPAGGLIPAVGDVILLGRHDVKAANEIELVRLVEAHRATGAFRAASVSDNARAGYPAPHYAVRGK